MTPNLLTTPAIFVIAGVGLLIVAIIGELRYTRCRSACELSPRAT